MPGEAKKGSGEPTSKSSNDSALSRRNILLAGTSLAAATAINAVDRTQVAQAQQQPQPAAPSGRKPNILVIFGDDIGQTNISAYSFGVVGYKTPNIDRLAREGMLFTDYYAENGCTAGRSSFITGQTPKRTGLTKVGIPGAPIGLQARDITIAQALKPLGYATGQFGKNHLGDRNDFLPTVHGFDEFFGNLYHHLNAEEEPERPYWPKDDKQYVEKRLAVCCIARRATGTIRPCNRIGAVSASRRSRTLVRSPVSGWRRSTTRLLPPRSTL
jgi:hypothetical protein